MVSLRFPRGAAVLGLPFFKLAMAVVGCLLLGSGTRVPAQEGGETTVLDILSYNIRYLNDHDGLDAWPLRRDAVAAAIADCDVVGMQEVVLAQLRDIQQRRPEFEWYAAGRDDGQQEGEMCAIGWRKEKVEVTGRGTFWLSDQPDSPGSVGWDAALPRIASWIEIRTLPNQRRLLLVNTHFDHRGATARHESAKLLRGWLRDNAAQRPQVLLGDLNAELTDAPLKALLEAGAADGFQLFDARAHSASQDPGPDSTWNGFREIVAGRRIDHILVTGNIDVLKFETRDPRTSQNRFASDHLPVFAKVELGAPDK